MNGKDKNKIKTNALRTLDSKKIPHQVYSYEAPDGFLDGVSAAKAMGLEIGRVFKTLVTQGASREYYVCVIPVACELNLKKAAKHFGEKKIEMIHARDLTAVTGYIKGGCSPLGMKKQFATAIDRRAETYDNIVVSAGKVGLQMDVPVSALLTLTGAELADLTDPTDPADPADLTGSAKML